MKKLKKIRCINTAGHYYIRKGDVYEVEAEYGYGYTITNRNNKKYTYDYHLFEVVKETETYEAHETYEIF